MSREVVISTYLFDNYHYSVHTLSSDNKIEVVRTLDPNLVTLSVLEKAKKAKFLELL